MDWTAGYVADIDYNSQYYSELNPVRLSLALLNAGYALPNIRNACELGFGQGVSVNIHAAAEGDGRFAYRCNFSTDPEIAEVVVCATADRHGRITFDRNPGLRAAVAAAGRRHPRRLHRHA